MIPVVELLRVSTESQAGEDRAGLPAQHAVNLRTSTQFGLGIVETVEIVESGAEVARTPGMARVLEAITCRRAAGIVLAEYSRLFRPDRWSDLVVLQTFADHGAPIYLPSGPIDLRSELGFVQATINNLLAAMERRRIRERMDRGKEEHRRRGAHVAGGVGIPFGMRYTKAGGWEWTEDAAVVRELFRRFLAGERSYNDLGRRFGLAASSAKFILGNPVYTGWRVYDRREDLTPAGLYPGKKFRRKIARRPEDVIRVRLEIEPLISEAEFALVQELVQTKTARHAKHSLPETFLYRGLLECDCGLPIYTKTIGGGKRFYYCRSRNRVRAPAGTVPCDNGGYMARELLEENIDRAIAGRLLTPDALVDAVAAYLEARAEERGAPHPESADLRGRLEQLARKRERILESFYDGVTSRAERDRRLGAVAAEIAATERMLGEMVRPAAEDLSEELLVALVQAFAEWPYADRAGRRSILDALSPTFYVRGGAVSGVRFPVASLTSGSDTRSQWRMDTTSAPCRSSSGTAT